MLQNQKKSFEAIFNRNLPGENKGIMYLACSEGKLNLVKFFREKNIYFSTSKLINADKLSKSSKSLNANNQNINNNTIVSYANYKNNKPKSSPSYNDKVLKYFNDTVKDKEKKIYSELDVRLTVRPKKTCLTNASTLLLRENKKSFRNLTSINNRYRSNNKPQENRNNKEFNNYNLLDNFTYNHNNNNNKIINKEINTQLDDQSNFNNTLMNFPTSNHIKEENKDKDDGVKENISKDISKDIDADKKIIKTSNNKFNQDNKSINDLKQLNQKRPSFDDYDFRESIEKQDLPMHPNKNSEFYDISRFKNNLNSDTPFKTINNECKKTNYDNNCNNHFIHKEYNDFNENNQINEKFKHNKLKDHENTMRKKLKLGRSIVFSPIRETCLEVVCRLNYTHILEYMLEFDDCSEDEILHLLKSKGAYISEISRKILCSKLSFWQRVKLLINFCCKCI